MMIVKVGNTFPDFAVVDDAILYAARNGANIITMSIAGAQKAAIDAALETAYNTYGVFIDAGAGNNSGAPVSYPANNQYVVAVGATDERDLYPGWPSAGPEIEVVAPGSVLYTTTGSIGYAPASGTSMAAPQVAGMAALMLSADPTLAQSETRDIINRTAEKVILDLFCTDRDSFYGFGRINAFAAVSQFPSFRYDVVPDREIDVDGDLLRTIDIILRRPPDPSPFELWAADVNNDQTINIGDVVLIGNVIQHCDSTSISPLVAGVSTPLGEFTTLSVSNGDVGSAGVANLSGWKIVSDPKAILISKGEVESAGIGNLFIKTTITDPIFAVQLFIGFDSKEFEMEVPELIAASGMMRLTSNVVGDEIRIVMYDPAGNAVKLNDENFLRIPTKSRDLIARKMLLEAREAIFITIPESVVGASLSSSEKEDEFREQSNLPELLSLGQNYPNPFNPSTTISFQVPQKNGMESIPASLKIYDLRGRLVRTLMDEILTAGSYTVHWDGRNNDGEKVGSGTYFYSITAGVDFRETKKMIILK